MGVALDAENDGTLSGPGSLGSGRVVRKCRQGAELGARRRTGGCSMYTSEATVRPWGTSESWNLSRLPDPPL
jgi:hypothetical protein